MYSAINLINLRYGEHSVTKHEGVGRLLARFYLSLCMCYQTLIRVDSSQEWKSASDRLKEDNGEYGHTLTPTSMLGGAGIHLISFPDLDVVSFTLLFKLHVHFQK